jgi:hypothetical protein
LPQAAQTDKPDLPPILCQQGSPRERNLPQYPRLVAHTELAEAAELQREPVRAQIVQQSGFERCDHGFYDHLRSRNV